MQKIMLSAWECKALDQLQTMHSHAEIVSHTLHKTWDKATYNLMNPDLVMKALIFGYVAETSAEEKIKYAYDQFVHSISQDNMMNLHEVYHLATKNALHALKINYEWLPDQFISNPFNKPLVNE